MSESVDIVPQIITEAQSTISTTSRGEALQWTQFLELSTYLDYIAAKAAALGENQAESVDWLAMIAALSGDLYDSYVARASLDAGTPAHNWTEAAMWRASTLTQSLRCPPFMEQGRSMFMALGHPDSYFDLFHGGNVLTAITYGTLPGITLFNGELGEIANFKLVISPDAHVFLAAGLDAGTSMNTGSGYVLSAASAKLDKDIHVTTATNVSAGRLLSVGLEETKVLTDAKTFYEQNERCKYVSGTTNPTVIGQAANGGMRHAHTTSDYCFNNDSVYPVVYGTPSSLVKVFAKETGEFGQLVGPKNSGLADQWQSLAWKWYGGYGRVAENYVLRGEYASSIDA
jgi:hypothetical protein